MSNGKRFGFVSLGVVAGGAALLAWVVTFSILKNRPLGCCQEAAVRQSRCTAGRWHFE